MATPLVSIIIPTFNRVNVLHETLASIKKQTYTHWEIVVLDDGSSDKTKTYMLEEQKNNNRIKFYLRSDFINTKGAPTCRNIGLDKAVGDFVMFLDSDDLLSPTCLQHRIETFQDNLDFDFLVFPGAFFTRIIEDSNLLWNKFTEEDSLIRFLRGDVVWQTTGPLWKKSFLLDHKHYFDVEAKSSQDWEFHIHILLQNPKYKTISGSPDYFIRRDDVDKNRISEGHYTVKKYINRIPLIRKMLIQIKTDSQFKALHKYLVRDTVSCLQSCEDNVVVNEFVNLNNLFPQSIAKGWNFTLRLINSSLKHNLKYVYRALIKVIDLWRPGYYKGFILNYKSKY